MLQVTFLYIGIFVLILVLASIFKRHQRTILWAAAICLFLGTMFTVGLGLVDITDGEYPNMPVITSISMTIVGAAILIVGAEKLHKKQREKGKEVQSDTPFVTSSVPTTPSTDDKETGVVLSGVLYSELARRVYAQAIEAGYMKEQGSHYKWNESKVLLAYMCGRIYCGDEPVYSDKEEKSYWKFGRQGVFPDTELSNLFEMPDLGQSRLNRKDLAVPLKTMEIDKFFE